MQSEVQNLNHKREAERIMSGKCISRRVFWALDKIWTAESELRAIGGILDPNCCLFSDSRDSPIEREI